METPLHKLAIKAFASGLKANDVPPDGYKYRDGKTWWDCVDAIHKGFCEGGGKFETEMDCAARRLGKVFVKVGN